MEPLISSVVVRGGMSDGGGGAAAAAAARQQRRRQTAWAFTLVQQFRVGLACVGSDKCVLLSGAAGCHSKCKAIEAFELAAPKLKYNDDGLSSVSPVLACGDCYLRNCASYDVGGRAISEKCVMFSVKRAKVASGGWDKCMGPFCVGVYVAFCRIPILLE